MNAFSHRRDDPPRNSSNTGTTRANCAMFKKILIANRGAIACRILRTLKALGISLGRGVFRSRRELAARRGWPTRRTASAPRRPPKVICAASAFSKSRASRARRRSIRATDSSPRTPISRKAASARASPSSGRRLHRCATSASSTRRARWRNECGLPLLPGTELLADLPTALAQAATIGYPVMLKSTAGGGGIGMRRCDSAAELSESFAAVQRLAAGNFRNAGVFLEKFVARARHIEVQIFGDGRGAVIALGERDCSVQRRNQKVIEESPAPGLDESTRDELHAAAVRLGEKVHYRSAGTVEFVYDARAGEVLLPRGEHAPAGGTRRHRGSRRHRPRRVDDPHRGWRAARSARAPARAARPRDPGARLCRRSGARLPAVERPADAGQTTRPRTSVRVDGWVEAGTEVTRLLRSHARQGDRARRHARARDRQSRGRTSAVPHRRHRDQPRLPGVDTGTSGVRRRRADHRDAGGPCTADLEHRSAGGRHADHRAGLAGAPGAVGRRRAAFGTHGRARAAPRQSHGGQRRRCGGAGDDGDRRDAALRRRCGDRARRRQHGSDARWRCRAVLATTCRQARQRARARKNRRRRPARLSRGARQLRHSRISRQPRHLHARTVRRPRRPRAARG